MRYEARAAIAMGAIVVVAAVGFVGLRSAMAPPMRAFPLSESTDSFVVRDPQFIRPDSATYARFAAADADWRRRYAAPGALRDASSRAIGASKRLPWHPSARQALDAQVYSLSRTGRLDDAIATLTSWVDRHPRDSDELLKLARLLNEAGRNDESVVRYRQLLALVSPARR